MGLPLMQVLKQLAISDYSTYGNDLQLVIHLDRPRDDVVNNTAAWQQNLAVDRLNYGLYMST